MNDIETLSFEDAMKELEEVVNRLEHGQVTLDQSIALYERGAKLRQHCERRLKDAQDRVDRITLSAQGEATGTTPAEGL